MTNLKSWSFIQVDGWTWWIENPDYLNPWFDNFQTILKDNIVKQNALRSVSRIELNGDVFYVKHDSPQKKISRLKSRFRSKVKMEFESAAALAENGVPVVDYLGWGQRGSEGMLLSRELRGSVNARDYWFGVACEDENAKNIFLDAFSVFLKNYCAANVSHPDFHLGNLLFRPEEKDFYVVDPYGAKKVKKLTNKQFFEILRILGALRGEIRDIEAISLIQQTGLLNKNEVADELWHEILLKEAAEINHIWAKREKQILSGDAKYCRRIQSSGFGKAFLRCSINREPLLSDEQCYDFEFLDDNYDRIILPEENAQRIWLTSFKLEFHRIQHRRVILWLKNENDENIVFFEKKAPHLGMDPDTALELERRRVVAELNISNQEKDLFY